MKQDLRVAVTKRMIREALLRLLETKPIDKIKVNALCAESGINRATFYRHYDTVHDVLNELSREITRQAFPPAATPKNMAEAQAMLEKTCAYLHDNADLLKILFRSNVEADLILRSNEFYQQVLELRTREPEFAGIDDDTVKLTVSLMGGGCYWLLRQWILEDIPKTPAQIAAIVCSVFRWPNTDTLLQSGVL